MLSKRYLIMVCILLLAAGSLSACGQKGPLYLPSGMIQTVSH